MSNPQHPQFANATAIDTRHVAFSGRVETDIRRAMPRRTGEQIRGLGIGVAALGLWAFLIAELAGKFNPPTVF